MEAKVYVGNLDRDTSEDHLRRAFERFGEVDEVILKDGFGFVRMRESRDAEDAIRELNGQLVHVIF